MGIYNLLLHSRQMFPFLPPPPPEYLWLCVFREYKIEILARDGLTLDGISDIAKSRNLTVIPPENNQNPEIFWSFFLGGV